MKILVTGGAGFIGSHIVEWFNDNADIKVLDNFSTGSKKNIENFKCEIIEGDITDESVVLEAVKGCDFIFHLAAFISVSESVKNPELCFDVNVKGTENVLRAASEHNVKKVVIASSCAVYGDDPSLPKKESSPILPKSPYAQSKYDAEKLCLKYSEKFEIPTCALRFFNVYGPRQDPQSPYAAVIPIFTELACNNKQITIFGDGSQTRDFVYVQDVVASCVLAAESLQGVYNVCTGVETSVNTLAELVIKFADSNSQITFAPKREGDIEYSYGDMSLIGSKGFSPKFDIIKGICETIRWFKG